MPTTITHTLVGLGLAEVSAPRPRPASFSGLAALLAVAPDVDVLAFRFGIPYGAFLGHRGFVHSPCGAVLAGLGAAALTASWFAVGWWFLFAFFSGAIASHDLLDGFTNGGLGIAYLSPFDTTRYFFPWRPIQVSPIGRGFFSLWGLRALLSEVVWGRVPLAVLVGAVLLLRGR
jgi:inner membrane protein